MKVLGIKINNYKSFSNEKNILRFDSESTLALIGKNESGKSNTLLALKELSFFDNNFNTNIFNDFNRLYDNPVSVSFEIEFNDDDFNHYNYKSNCSKIYFKKHDNYFYINFDGCLSEIIENDDELNELVEEIKKFNNKNYNDKNAEVFKNKLDNYTTTFIKLQSGISHLSMNSIQTEIYNRFKEKMQQYYDSFNKVLPKIIYFSNDMVLKNKYTLENITKNEDIQGLLLLLEAINFPLEDLKDWLITSDVTKKQKYSTIMKNKLEDFNHSFQEYYKTNKISLMHNVDSKNLEFTIMDDINPDGISITNFSERSDGLKWFISLFIKVYSAKKTNKYSLILLDEPGSSLHVLAQKELLKFLMKSDNYQILYTTHSPYMIDIEHLENIRLVRKQKFTTITNGINNERTMGKTSYKETITPILEAIGLSLNYNFGPSPKKNNLIVEGITDYYYINSMLKYFKVPNEKIPNIIPCIGATNERNIVSILYGWGYNYKCLLDNDREGKRVYDEISSCLGEKNLFFVDDNKNSTIECLISENVQKTIDVGSKILNAKKFASLIHEKKTFLDSTTISKFKKLFIKLDIIDLEVQND